MTKLKWAIKRTPENYKEVNDWANKTFSLNFEQDYYFLYSERAGEEDYLLSDEKHPDSHEITIDEFRLLTDPDQWFMYGGPIEKRPVDYDYFIGKQEATRTEIQTFPFIHVSEPVFNELQRMWKERESDKIGEIEIGTGLNFNTEVPFKDRDMSGIIGLLPKPKFHVDDFKTESEKQTLKLLKKINRKLNRILKRQKEQF